MAASFAALLTACQSNERSGKEAIEVGTLKPPAIAPVARSDDDRWLELKKYGEAYYLQKRLDKAEADLTRATEIARRFKQPDRRLADSLRLLGDIYAAEGKQAEAEKTLSEALSASESADDPKAQIMVLQSLYYFYLKHDFEKCKYYADRMLKDSQQALAGKNRQLMEPLWFLGICCQTHKKFAQAAGYFKQAIDLSGGEIDGSNNELGLSLLSYGQCCVELGRTRKAEEAFARYLQWAKVADHPVERTDFGPTVMAYFVKTGKRKQAIDFLDTWMGIANDRLGKDSTTYRDAARIHRLIDQEDAGKNQERLLLLRQ